MGSGAAIRRATKLACAIGAVGGILGVPAAATADVTHPFRPQNPSSYLAAKRAAQAQAGLGNPLGPLMAPAGAGPKAVVAPPSLNLAGLAAGDNAARNGGTPPDPTGAVGPSHYVEFVNSVVGVYSKANLTPVGAPAQLDTFIGRTNDFVFDPQIQYDPVADRWFYLADDCLVADCTAGNFLAYGWSKTNDPSDLVNGWCRFRIRTDSGAAGPTGYFDDYPKLGHNDSHLVFGTNVFDVVSNFVSSRIWTVPKPPAGTITDCAAGTGTPHWFSGSAASPTKDGNIATNPLTTSDSEVAFGPVPANTQDASPNAYIVAADAPIPTALTRTQIMAWHVSGAAGSEALTADGNIGVSSFTTPANVPQPPPSTDVLDSSDTRLTQAVAHADPDAGAAAVWTQHTIDGPGGRSVVRWYELLPGTATPRQEGNISNPSSFVFNGAISPTMAGNDAVIQYNVGGAAQLAQIRASSRTSASALGSMTGEITLGTSAAGAQDFSCPSAPNGGPACRWGDYAGATPDPCNAQLVWGTNQLIGTAAGTNPRWTTRNFALLANGGPVAAPIACFTAQPNPAFTAKVVTFDASDSTSAITKYEWDLDGVAGFETNTDAVNHTSRTYSQVGTFNVRLRVTEGATTDTMTRSLTIKSGAPTAAFSAPAVVGRGQSVRLDGSASADAEAPGGIESYQWDFDGDGVTDQTTAGPVVTHAFPALGSFNTRLAVTDADDHEQSTTAVRQVTVQNVAPIAQIAFSPGAPQTGQPVSFSAAGASDPDGTIVNYRWDLDGDGVFETDTGAQPQASRTYSTPGTFAATVRIQDNDGTTATAGSSVGVVAAPVAPPVTPASLKLALKFAKKGRLATLLKRGLAGSVSCGRACTVRLTLRISSKVARQMKTPAVIGKATIVVKKSGAKAVRIRLTSGARKRLRSARSFAITVTGTAADSARLSASGKTIVQIKR